MLENILRKEIKYNIVMIYFDSIYICFLCVLINYKTLICDFIADSNIL